MKSNPLEYIINGIVIITFIGFGVLLLLRPETLNRDLMLSGTDDILLMRANSFVEYRMTLSNINIDTQFFSSEQFRSLRNERLLIPELPIGKPSLFDAANISPAF